MSSEALTSHRLAVEFDDQLWCFLWGKFQTMPSDLVFRDRFQDQLRVQLREQVLDKLRTHRKGQDGMQAALGLLCEGGWNE